MTHKSILIPLFLCSTLLAPFAAAQTTASPFIIRVTQGQTGVTVAEGATVTLASEAPRAPVDATISLTNRTTAAVTINRVSFTGNLDFKVTTPVDDTPLNVPPGATVSAPVRFTPTSSERVTGTVTVAYTENRVEWRVLTQPGRNLSRVRVQLRAARW